MGSSIPAKYTLICIFPIRVLLENDLLGGGVLRPPCPGFGWFTAPADGFIVNASASFGSGWATVSCKSCAQGASAGPEGGGI